MRTFSDLVVLFALICATAVVTAVVLALVDTARTRRLQRGGGR